MSPGEIFEPQSQPARGARREILHQHIGACDEFRQNGARLRILHIERDAFLGSVGPHEVRSQPFDPVIVVTRKIPAPGALDLDHAGTEIGQLARAKRRGDGVFDGNDRDAVERPRRRRGFSRPRCRL